MVELSRLGVIGNCRSAALVTGEGSIVWSCLPDFDSPSVFAGLLDDEFGGELSFIPEAGANMTQTYVDRTNILRTVFEEPSGKFEVFDFMPIYTVKNEIQYQPPEIYRLIRVACGKPIVSVHFRPKLNYSLSTTLSTIQGEFIKSVTTKSEYHSRLFQKSAPK